MNDCILFFLDEYNTLSSDLVKGLLDLVEVIEVVLHCHTDGVHSMRAHQPLPGQKLIQVILINTGSHSRPENQGLG